MQTSQEAIFTDLIPGAAHWSMRVPQGHILTATDLEGGANLSLLFYNPDNLLERYNAPDTLKCQHTFKLTTGHCLYSDMGRVFCTIVRDDTGWIDTVCGVANKTQVTRKWGERNYQGDRNRWKQNGYDALLVEVAKYGLGKRDLAANLNLFSRVSTDAKGNLSFTEHHSQAGNKISLRFEMDTLVVLTTCPHPLNPATDYPFKPVELVLTEDIDPVMPPTPLHGQDENRRGRENNRRYHSTHSNHTPEAQS
jgi:urea carboxylase-associated protein 2